jgi:NADPH:quinone reductase-like Zn-dependent oxidoreductase
MRAMVVRRYGPPEMFEAREQPDPAVKPGETLVVDQLVGPRGRAITPMEKHLIS